MRTTGYAFTVITVCMLMLWAGTVEAQGKRKGPPFDPTLARGGLPICQTNLNICNAGLTMCVVTDLPQCQGTLMTCTVDLAACMENSGSFPATGQTTDFQADKNDGLAGPVAVDDDGTLQLGAALNYTDNGDGTITDLNTGLMWEKKCDCGGLHDVDNTYLWSGNGSQETIWDWLDDVNAEGGPGHAGFNDWRISNIRELQSIVDYGRYDPAIDPTFVPTASRSHWSSTTWAAPGGSTTAWAINFIEGFVGVVDNKTTFPGRVRAVRGP